MIARPYRRDGGTRIMLEQRGRIRLAGIENVDAVIRDGALACRNLCRADIHATVDLHGIGGDDLAVKRGGDDLGKRGLSRCRRALDAHDHVGGIRHQTSVPCR